MLAAFGGIQGIMNSGMSGKQLLEGLSGAAWNSSVADGKSAADLINGYKNGTLAQSAGAIAGYKPVSNVSGGTVNDMNQATGAQNASSGVVNVGTGASKNSGSVDSAWVNSFASKVKNAAKSGDLQKTLDSVWANYAESYPNNATPLLYGEIQKALGLGADTGSGTNSVPGNTGASSGSTTYIPSTGTSGSTSPGTWNVNDLIASLGGSTTVAPAGDSSDYSKQISESIAKLEADYRNLLNSVQNGDYTKKSYYQTILDSYGLAGDDAASDAAASAAGANGGNLDSYAAANARRQELAYRNAAQNAALSAYNAEIENMLNTLSGLGVNVNDLYGTWGGELDSQRKTLADVILGQLNADTAKYQTDKESELQKFLGQLGYDSDIYGYDTQKQMNTESLASQEKLATAQNALSTKLAEMERLMNQDKLASNEKVQSGINETNRLIAEYESALNKLGLEMDDAMKQKTLDYQKWATQYQTDAEERMFNANLNAAAGDEGTEDETYEDPTPEQYDELEKIFKSSGMDAAIQHIDKQPYNLRYRLTEYMNRWLVPWLIKKEGETDNQFAGNGSGRPTLETKIMQ